MPVLAILAEEERGEAVPCATFVACRVMRKLAIGFWLSTTIATQISAS